MKLNIDTWFNTLSLYESFNIANAKAVQGFIGPFKKQSRAWSTKELLCYLHTTLLSNTMALCICLYLFPLLYLVLLVYFTYKGLPVDLEYYLCVSQHLHVIERPPER